MTDQINVLDFLKHNQQWKIFDFSKS